ncbi:MAG: helix-turn-helix domain-containing protein [Oscillospiraceae bacterium]|nr:helix-turn-helix domain-containing protein [Oscillospiraceae bacterium]
MCEFSERLRSLRLIKKVMAKEVAEMLGVTYRNYQRYERGEIEPNIQGLVALADLFNVSTDYLLGRTSNPEVNR